MEKRFAVLYTSCSPCGTYSGESFCSLHTTKEEAAEKAASIKEDNPGFGWGAVVREALEVEGGIYISTK